MAFYLYIMRHAKSDWSIPGKSDFDRPINKRGQKNAKRIGQWMAENNHIPQQIISSPAQRARQTTKLVANQLSKDGPEKILYDQELYLAGLDTLIECIQIYKNDLNSLMLVAHNPGMEQLITYLSSKSVNSDMNGKTMTTANLVIFEYPDSNFDLEVDKGELVEFIKPKELA
jgi:phosphohistidine phosphatase